MTNHAHFIAVPEKADSLARCFSDVHVRYTRMINKRQEWKGHLWQARFGSNVLDENYLLAAVRYVERNPVRAGMVKNAWEYPWSSGRRSLCRDDTKRRDGEQADWRSSIYQETGKAFSVQAAAAEAG